MSEGFFAVKAENAHGIGSALREHPVDESGGIRRGGPDIVTVAGHFRIIHLCSSQSKHRVYNSPRAFYGQRGIRVAVEGPDRGIKIVFGYVLRSAGLSCTSQNYSGGYSLG